MSYWFRYLLYRQRYRMLRIYRAALFSSMILLLVLLIYHMSLSGNLSKSLQGLNFSLFDIAVSWTERDPRGLMRSAAPVIAWAGNGEDHPEIVTPGSLVTAILNPFRVNFANPSELLASEMPALAEYKKEYSSFLPATVKMPPEQTGPVADVILSANALLGIYYTHTCETYTITDGTDRLPGEKGGVVQAGLAVKDKIERDYGIRVVHNDRVNDVNYSLSYVESEKTARRLLEENKDVQILLDIHRDAGKSRSDSLVKVKGVDVAPILFIAGSDARSPFPSWRNNYNFALELSGRINDRYPGLSLGVRVKEGRYNQFLHPRAILVEIGTDNNSTDEAVQSARLMAEILAEMLVEIAPELVGQKTSSDNQQI